MERSKLARDTQRGSPRPSPSPPLRSPSAGALGRCYTPLPTEKERGKGGRGGNGVLFSPSRVDFLGSFQQRRGRGKEGGEVRWSLERTSERTRRRVSARSRSREGGRALRRRRYHARWGRNVAEQRKITRGKVEAIPPSIAGYRQETEGN